MIQEACRSHPHILTSSNKSWRPIKDSIVSELAANPRHTDYLVGDCGEVIDVADDKVEVIGAGFGDVPNIADIISDSLAPGESSTDTDVSPTAGAQPHPVNVWNSPADKRMPQWL